jgi:hypothetical protein
MTRCRCPQTPGYGDGRVSEQSLLRRGLPIHVALCVADAVRWLGWWLMKALVEWGAVLCSLRASADWTADLPRPRALRHDFWLRREIALGFAQIEAYLSATGCADDTSRPSEEKIHRTRLEGGNG